MSNKLLDRPWSKFNEQGWSEFNARQQHHAAGGRLILQKREECQWRLTQSYFAVLAMRYLDDSSKRIAAIDGGSGWNGNHLGLTSTVARTQYMFDLPYSLSNPSYFKGMLVDFPGVRSRSIDLSTANLVWKTFKLATYAGSALESFVWQENGRTDAVSTVRGIQFAKEQSIEILTINSTNQATQLAKLTSNADASLDYTSGLVSQIQAATNVLVTDQNGTPVSGGYTVTVPRSLIRYDNWTGAVWIQERNLPNNVSAGFTISGGYSGGLPLYPIINIYATDTNTGIVCTNPTNALSFFDVTPDTISSIVGLGNAPSNTLSNDPVNMVTGNMYHTERDIALKGRGGLPIVFERSYNSRDDKDGPLGYGWTHSFNQYLTFDDDNQNSVQEISPQTGAPNNFDNDGLTSSVTWVDGTGARKFIQVNGTSGGVLNGSVFTAPKGFYFTTTRNGASGSYDGTFTIREKNGMTYTFEGLVAGIQVPSGLAPQKARLKSITDRNNNTLTLSYTATATCDGTYVCSVTDGVVTNGKSHTLTFSYDAATNHITEIKEWTGRSFQYGYTDGKGNLNSFKNPLAASGAQPQVTYVYYTTDTKTKLVHSMKSYNLPRGNGMTFEYYTNGKVFRHTTTAGEATTFTYNDFRRESVSTNAQKWPQQFGRSVKW
ncbi:MAG: hypothetical protein HY306_02395 [Nitrosomonadales bacterium]|nr:hypothetical protein [Nitrosomonadales bacterium]